MTPLSDIGLLEIYQAVNIHVRIAREITMPEPKLGHLVALRKLCDTIAVGEYQLHLAGVRAHGSIPIHNAVSAWVLSGYDMIHAQRWVNPASALAL
jgi:hypothetical protein